MSQKKAGNVHYWRMESHPKGKRETGGTEVRGRLASQKVEVILHHREGGSLASQRFEGVSHHGARSTFSFMLPLLLGIMILI